MISYFNWFRFKKKCGTFCNKLRCANLIFVKLELSFTKIVLFNETVVHETGDL